MPRKPPPVEKIAAAVWLDHFVEFIKHLSIDSKETGVGPLELYGSQQRFLAELVEGLERDVHTFVFLKARQLGISTVSLAVDLFWLVVHPGLQGALVTDTEGNRDKFRILLARFIASLPRSYAVGIAKSNRNNLVLENGSVLDFIVAGTRKTASEVGRSRAYNFLHATEVANYGSVEGVVSLFNTLAEKHPHRLYIFESTAKGFNLFWTMWNQARADPITQKAAFIGWWAKEEYAVSRDSPIFARYWDGEIDEQEQERVNLVYKKYGVQIRPEQLAWYRWKLETRQAQTSLMDQDFPWDEEDAFLQTGQTFFPVKKATKLITLLSENPPPFKGYTYEFGDKFMETKLVRVNHAEEADLKIYEEPSELGSYVMGVDPAYGRSENQDRSVVQIYRCFADRLVQVAEYASTSPESYQCAWVMAHLAGTYKNIMVILEISGPGAATALELKHLRELFDAGAMPAPAGGKMEDLFGNVRRYMYQRTDSPGAGFQYDWKTNMDNKLEIMNQLRDSFTLGMVEVRSLDLAIEIQSMVQDGFSIEPAISSQKDDRVLGTAFAHRAWTQWVRGTMIAANETWEVMMKREAASKDGSHETMVSFIVSEFFQGKKDDREEQEIEDQWK